MRPLNSYGLRAPHSKNNQNHAVFVRYIEHFSPVRIRYLKSAVRAKRRAKAMEELRVPVTIGSGDGGTVFNPALGEFLGGGEYGKVFVSRYAGDTRRFLAKMARRSRHWLYIATPKPNADVCIKVGYPQKGQSALSFLNDSIMEASWHARLATAPSIRLPNFKPFRASDFVPRFYRSGWVRDEGTRSAAYVTVMSQAPGMEVEDLKGPLSAEAYVSIERAVAVMWMYGIVHADLHLGNLFFDPATMRATILDFGAACLLPDKMQVAVRKNMMRAMAEGVRSLGEVWLFPKESRYGAGVFRFVNKVVYDRFQDRKAWYNPDGRTLMALYDRVPKGQRTKVPELRLEAWGFRGRRLW
jgi:hypothetical protein